MMKKMLMAFAISTLALACGDDTDNDKRSPTPATTAPSGQSGGSGAAGGDGSGRSGAQTNVSCEDACGNAIDKCGTQFGAYEDCVSVCPDMGQSMLNCIGGATSCQDLTNACASGEPADNNRNNHNNVDNPGDTAAPTGASCTFDDDCSSNFCRTLPSSQTGVCAVNDFGEICRTDDDCGGICTYRDQHTDSYGQCTYTCDSFTDCPTFWKCRQLGNGAASVCWDE